MKVVGLTGGMGTGKSAVAEILRDLGWVVLSSDETARSLMNSDAAMQKRIAEALGNDVLSDKGLDRERIAALVFGDSTDHAKRLAQLNAIVHPRVLDEHMTQLKNMDDDGVAIAAVETALLYEVGLDDAFDFVIVVDAPDDVRRARIRERSGLTDQQITDRLAQQMPMADKRGLADFVIDNTGTLADLRRSVETLARIIELIPKPEHTD
ncbi:MAG: dephospho-CoA kinase [Bradyrhizobiaceae bacterium]|nr:dephospho-CoA kinase [Bradyrhizobiaceae bacterium]